MLRSMARPFGASRGRLHRERCRSSETSAPLRREPGRRARLVLVGARRKVRRHARVRHAARLAGQDI